MSDVPNFRPALWGYLQVSPMRYGVLRFRLVMLAPGSTPGEYRVMRFADASVWAAVATWTVSLMVLMPPIGPPGGEVASFFAACVLAAAVGWFVHRSARRVRRTAKEVEVCREASDRSGDARGLVVIAERANAMMCVADDLRERRIIDAVEYELVWCRAWELLPEKRDHRHVVHPHPQVRS